MFKPGESGNKEGRKKGSLNKKTILWNSLSTKFVDVHSNRIDEHLDELWATNKTKFVELYVSLIGYHRPKLKATELKTNIDSLSDQQVDTIVNKILDNEKTATY